MGEARFYQDNCIYYQDAVCCFDCTADIELYYRIMDDKLEAIHVEEQSTHESDRTNTQLLTEDGIVLIPQPTADPNGRRLPFPRWLSFQHD